MIIINIIVNTIFFDCLYLSEEILSLKFYENIFIRVNQTVGYSFKD